MQPLEPKLDSRVLTRFDDLLLDLIADLLNDLFDPGRMHAAVSDESLERFHRDRLAHLIET